MAGPAAMQCLVCAGDRVVSVTERPVPEPGPDEVRVRIRASAICGSDLHKYRESAAARAADGRDQLILGHEGAGVVDAVGVGVVHPHVGDRVVIYHLIGCGHCQHCRHGEPGFCAELTGFNWKRDGTNAEYVVVPPRALLPLPDDFDFVDGALLACNVGTAYGAARKAGASGDTTLAVFGLGPVGLLTAMVGRAMGARVVGVDVQPSRLELAEQLGVDATVDAREADALDRLRAFGDGRGVHAAIDTSGSTRARADGIDVLRPHGTFVEVGLGPDPGYPIRAPLNMREIIIRGSWIFKLYEWEDLLDFARRHTLPIQDVVARHFAPEDAVEAFQLADAATAGKLVFDWA